MVLTPNGYLLISLIGECITGLFMGKNACKWLIQPYAFQHIGHLSFIDFNASA
jgi:hypothetical protein